MSGSNTTIAGGSVVNLTINPALTVTVQGALAVSNLLTIGSTIAASIIIRIGVCH